MCWKLEAEAAEVDGSGREAGMGPDRAIGVGDDCMVRRDWRCCEQLLQITHWFQAAACAMTDLCMACRDC
ncbi:hypothetical protein TRIATDRAFT_256486, partial [Trichoderma atroviride IMI 206040]